MSVVVVHHHAQKWSTAMAVMALTNEYLSINATVMSSWVKSATLTVDVAALDSTAMGDAWTDNIGGLKSGTLAVTFNDDLAAGAVDVTLWPLLGTVVPFEVRLDAGAASATNPKYTGSVLINQHMIGGSVGDLAGKTFSFPTSGAITRATS
jgi:hypothetical protein